MAIVVAIEPTAASMLSRRLNEFVMTTIHTTVMTQSAGPPNSCTRAPAAAATVAAPASMRSRSPGLTVRMSSNKPVIATSTAAARIAAASPSHPDSTSEQATAPSAIATPPK